MSGHTAIRERCFSACNPGSLTVQKVVQEEQAEILEFLSQRPMHTFGEVGMILTNGLISPLNRGTFYVCRDHQGRLEGVALIGHNNLFEARSEEAICAFAKLFQANTSPFLLMGEEDKIERFSYHFNELGALNADTQGYLLYRQNWPIEVREPINNLRLATMDDLELVVDSHAEAGIEENGIDGRVKDPLGFTQRCANRILKQKTWVWIEKQKLIFKVEVVTSTPDVAYLESVWVRPDERNKGYGLRCIAQLGRTLLQESSSICLLVSEKNQTALSLYEKAGYKKLDRFLVLFFEQ